MSGRPIASHLLPDTAEVADDGQLHIGGVALTELAANHGTPLFVYDERHLRSRCREAAAAFGPDAVYYASKAFLCKAMARLVHEEGLLIDVATGGEMHIALAAGVPANRLVLHGNNKSTEELRAALEAGVYRIVVDSFDEMDRIDALHRAGLPKAPVKLRLTPGVYAHTHEFISTGHDDVKFGFTVSTGAAHAAVMRAHRAPSMELHGIHCHIGSNVFRSASFAEAMAVMAGIANPLDIDELTIGGGLGVAYIEDETAPSIAEWGKVILDAAAEHGVRAKVSVEPGRSIVAGAAVTLYTVGTIKVIPGVRRYISVDGGMSDNPRPVLYGSGYEAFLPRAPRADRALPARLVGKHCETGDILIDEAWLPVDVEVGDILATPVTGAYGYGMASNYNAVTRPAVVFVKDGDVRTVIRRESADDLLRNDVG